jgi:hypothetical protein
MAKPPGSVVSIYWDGWEDAVEGDLLRSATGRTYRIVGVRVQQRGKHVGRQHLTCVVQEPDFEPVDGEKVHMIVWYSRNKKRRAP